MHTHRNICKYSQQFIIVIFWRASETLPAEIVKIESGYVVFSDISVTFLNSNNVHHLHWVGKIVCLVDIGGAFKWLLGHGQTGRLHCDSRGSWERSACESKFKICSRDPCCVHLSTRVSCLLFPANTSFFFSFWFIEKQHICLKLCLVFIVIWKKRLLLMKVVN